MSNKWSKKQRIYDWHWKVRRPLNKEETKLKGSFVENANILRRDYLQTATRRRERERERESLRFVSLRCSWILMTVIDRERRKSYLSRVPLLPLYVLKRGANSNVCWIGSKMGIGLQRSQAQPNTADDLLTAIMNWVFFWTLKLNKIIIIIITTNELSLLSTNEL